MSPTKPSFYAFLAFAAIGLIPARAVDVSDISIHGSVSDTESYSDTYNFYGNTSGKFDNNVRELTLNGGYRWASGLRASAQIYAADVDGYSSIDLDFASLDYSVQPWFGLRIGRNKSTIGLYGDSQDLDQVRTFANLPLGFYPRTRRTLNYTDGLNVYGNISTARAGSFDYTVFGGRIENIPSTALIARSSGGLTIADGFTLPFVIGVEVFWNTPIDGLRLAAGGFDIPHLGDRGHLATRAFATQPGLTTDYTPLAIDGAYGPGAWDALFAGSPTTSSISLADASIGAEYSAGKWIIAAEAKQEPEHLTSNVPALGVKGSYSKSLSQDAYASVTFQATKQVGVGAYYGYTDTDANHDGSSPRSLTTQKDLAGVISYAPLPWWLIKVEVHSLDGLALVNQAGDYNPNAPTAGTKWTYLVFKTSLSF